MKKHILCCDWGTSSFRLQLVEFETSKTICSVESDEGIAKTFDQWIMDNNEKRLNFYQRKLTKGIAMLAEQTNICLDNLPIVISGMASSSIGILELPYATLPFNIDGEQAQVCRINASENFPHEIFLISGLQSENDMMRGEETQCVGLKNRMMSIGNPVNMLLILPGTHSKHIYFKDTSIVHFETYITGELFAILQNHSLLKEATAKRKDGMSQEDWEAFVYGVLESKSARLLRSLFKVRVGQLSGRRSKEQSYFYLSGLLIGSELKDIQPTEEQKIVLCSGSALFDLYKRAITELGLMSSTYFVPPEEVDDATVLGQIKIFKANYHHEFES